MSFSMAIRFFTCGVVAGAGIGLNVGQFACVVGPSMRPTLNPHKDEEDIVLVVYAKFTTVSRGDVVILLSPKDDKMEIIKRVVGLEGDVVFPTKGFSAVKVPKGHCWVEGDNTRVSEDSNCFGPVPMDLIVGKATRIVWPPDRWGKISPGSPTDRYVHLKTSST